MDTKALLLLFGVAFGAVVLVWLLRLVLRSRKWRKPYSSQEAVLDLSESGSLTPEEREQVKKKVREQLKRDMEKESSAGETPGRQ